MNFDEKNEIINHALLLSKSNKIILAIEMLKKVYHHYPNDFQTLYNISKIYLEQKDYITAIKYYKYLLVVNPKDVQARFDLSYIYLINRNLIKGFEMYEYRLKFEEYHCFLSNNYPKYTSDISNKRILLYWEQGFGDTINFIRYIKYLIKYTNKIDILVQKPLLKLLKLNFSQLNFIEDNRYLDKNYEYVFPLLSLPYIFKIDFFCSIDKYLNVRKKDFLNYKKQYIVDIKKFNIGLCWQGEFQNKKDKERSFNIIDFFNKIYEADIKYFENIQFYSLQKEIRVQSNNIIDLGVTFCDFYDTSLAIKCMDLVITVDTAVCHLSAALGKKTYLLLPYHSDWRWGKKSKKSDLYKRVKYFRQVENNFWDKPFNLLIFKLKKLNLELK